MKPSLKIVTARIQKILEKLQKANDELDIKEINVEAIATKFMTYYRQIDIPREEFDDRVYLVFEVCCPAVPIEGILAHEGSLSVY